MSRALAAPMTWVWLAACALAAVSLAAAPPWPFDAQAIARRGIWPLALTILLVLSTHRLLRTAGRRHGWAAGVALAATVAALPALSLRPEALAAAERHQAQDTAWPDIRPSGHVALLSCEGDCRAEAAALLAVGAYSVFVPDKTLTDPSWLPADLPGRSLRRCLTAACDPGTASELGFNDLAVWSGHIAVTDDPYVVGLTRHLLLRQTEGTWTEIARDTTVHYRTPGPWPTTATLPGALGTTRGPLDALAVARRP